MEWSKEQEQELTKLFLTQYEGAYLSHRSIGERMVPPLSRNAVIGKAHRLKLSRDPLVPCRGVDNRLAPTQKSSVTMSSVPKTYGRRGLSRPARVPSSGAGEAAPRTATAISVLEVTDNTCRFPIGHVEQEGFHLCGAHTDKAPYCEHHHAICFYPPKERTRPTWRRP